MIFIRRILFILTPAALLSWPHLLYAQHVHINAGAFSTAQDAQLYFVNGSNYGTNAGYDVYLSFTNAGSFAHRYQGAGVSFTALASTGDNGGPAFGHAAEGAFLELQFVSVSGPANGTFAVWEEDAPSAGTHHLLFAIPTGTMNGTNQFNLSESDGSPGSDPYGHVHGRTFAASAPGLYTVGCQILDTSTNGTGGGPIHTPSDIYYFYFQAGLTISSTKKTADSFSATFGTHVGASYYVETATHPAATNWTPLAGPIAGNNYLQTIATTDVTAPHIFIRIKSDQP